MRFGISNRSPIRVTWTVSLLRVVQLVHQMPTQIEIQSPLPSLPNLVTCERCGAKTALEWILLTPKSTPRANVGRVHQAICFGCYQSFIAFGNSIVFPKMSIGDVPSEDMPELVRIEYEEARIVGASSPRAAGALLRLAIEKLVDDLVQGGDSLDMKIGILVETGRIRQQLAEMLDVVRVIGNNAVHPGQIDLNETPEVIEILFKLVNAIVEQTISIERLVRNAQTLLPANALAGIEQRPTRVKKRLESR